MSNFQICNYTFYFKAQDNWFRQKHISHLGNNYFKTIENKYNMYIFSLKQIFHFRKIIKHIQKDFASFCTFF